MALRGARARASRSLCRLGVRLPIYVLVTKTDLLAGFMEFFASSTATAARRSGATFRPRRSPPATRCALRRGIRAPRRPALRDASRAPAGRARPAAPRRDLPLPAAVPRHRASGRGVHGSSVPQRLARRGAVRARRLLRERDPGRQPDRPRARHAARSFNLERKVQPPNLGSGKSYFLRRLLHEVIFGEAGLAGATRGGRPAARALLLTRWRPRHRARPCGPPATSATAAWWPPPTRAAPRASSTSCARCARTRRAGRRAECAARGRAGRLRRCRAGLYQGKARRQADRAYRNACANRSSATSRFPWRRAARAEPRRAGRLRGSMAARCHISSGDAAPVALAGAARADLAAHLRVALAERPLALPRPRDEALIEQSRRKLGTEARHDRPGRRAHDGFPSAGTARFPAPATSSRGAYRSFREPWTAGCRGHRGSKQRLGAGWHDAFLSMPAWRFVLGPGLLGGNAWAGLMVPSVDAVGRYFPLAVACALPSASLDPVATLLAAGPWFETSSRSRSRRSRRAPIPRRSTPRSQRRFEARWLRLPEASDSTMPERARSRRWCASSSRPTPACRAPARYRRALCEPNSAWLAEPSELFGRALLLCEDLPPGEQFCAMMDGRWVEHGWGRPTSRN